MTRITAYQYFIHTGYLPEIDDLERINCHKKGAFGHKQCGWLNCCNRPVFYGCVCIKERVVIHPITGSKYTVY